MEPYEIEAFWEDLLAYIEQQRVLPVIGAELLTTLNGGVPTPLYRIVANTLLRKYPSPGEASANEQSLQEHRELSDAVCALARRPRMRVNDLYRPIHDILQKVVEGQEMLKPLRQLAAIRDFDLFATTTPDNLLAQALNDVRFAGAPQTDEIEYAPKLPTDRRRDIPSRQYG